MEENKQNYSAGNIQVLEGLEAVRKRPAMYIGDIGVKGLHHLIWEVIDNSIDEAMAGYCDTIGVEVMEDNSIRVSDNGRGIPVDFHEKEKKSALEVVMTVLHAGGKFDKDTYKVSGGLHGVGVSCVNALSRDLKVTVEKDGSMYQQEYKIGVPQYPVKKIGTSDKRGTTVQFWPDTNIFTASVFNDETISNRLRELAYLNKGIRINFTDHRETLEDGTHKFISYFSEGGLKEFAIYLDETRQNLFEDPIYMEGEKSMIQVQVAMLYNNSYAENVHSYVNNINHSLKDKLKQNWVTAKLLVQLIRQ
jgi:DNA gyrase subunit B